MFSFSFDVTHIGVVLSWRDRIQIAVHAAQGLFGTMDHCCCDLYSLIFFINILI